MDITIAIYRYGYNDIDILDPVLVFNSSYIFRVYSC